MNLKKLRILIVDDDQSMLRITGSLLKQLGFENIEEAADGPTALIKLHQQNFDLILSDWNMVPMSGLEFLIQIRADPALMHIPFIMATAESTTENIVAAKQAGATNYLIKPFSASILKDKLIAIVGPF